MKRKVGTIFAHPDDEVLGCGGTSSKYAMSGSDVHTLILSRGVTSRLKFNKKNQSDLIAQAKKASKIQEIMNDLVGAVIIDTHRDLKKAWKAVVKSGVTPEKLKALGQMPVTEAELLSAAEKWSDNVYRNKTINSWVAFSKKKYQKLN